MPETSYAPCGGLSLAYQVYGDGPVELIYAAVSTIAGPSNYAVYRVHARQCAGRIARSL